MKIGIMISNLNSSAKTFKFCQENGLDGVQLGISYGRYHVDKVTDRRYAALEKKLIGNNLEISAYCGELGGHGFMIEGENPKKIALCKRMIDFAAAKNVKIISTHIGVIPSDKNDKIYKTMQRALTEVGLYALERDITIAIETGPERAIVLKEFIDSLRGGIGVNLDPANLTMCARQDAVEAVYILKDYIVHTHAKDGVNLQPVDPRFVYGFVDENDKKELVLPGKGKIYNETRLGEGGVDWAKYIKALKDIGYDGYLTIEREFGKRTMQDVKDAAAYLKNHIYTKDIVNIGIIGCGNIASCAHIPALEHNNRVKVLYTCDLIKERAEKARERTNARKAVTDYHEVLNDKEVDGVLICTHTDFHTIIAIDAMKAGKHVMSEKPVALNYGDALKMAEVSRTSGKILNIAVCMRYNSGVNRIKSLIDSGVIGELYHVVCSFRAFRRIPGIGGDFTQKSRSGGGVLMDWGIHYLDLILYIMNSPSILTATGDAYSQIGKDVANYRSSKFHWGEKTQTGGIYDVEDFVTGHIRTEKGVSISFNGAWAQNIKADEEYIDFLGTKGGIRYYYCRNFAVLLDAPKGFKSVKPIFGNADMYNLEMLDFANAIRNGNNNSSRNKIDNILSTAQLLDWIYASSSKKREIINGEVD